MFSTNRKQSQQIIYFTFVFIFRLDKSTGAVAHSHSPELFSNCSLDNNITETASLVSPWLNEVTINIISQQSPTAVRKLIGQSLKFGVCVCVLFFWGFYFYHILLWILHINFYLAHSLSLDVHTTAMWSRQRHSDSIQSYQKHCTEQARS